MNLNDCKPFDEGIDCFNRNLLPLVEYNVHTLKQSYEVLTLYLLRQRLLKQALNHSI